MRSTVMKSVTRTSVFLRARWTAALATLAALVAMLLYPGGTARDHATVGYRIAGNFLSDLGMTVAYDGRPNRAGAALFISSIALLVIGLGGALIGFVTLYGRHQRARRFAWAAVALGALACICFIGVAFTPENSAMAAHVAFTLAGFRILPLVTLFLALAARAARAGDAASATFEAASRATKAWSALTAVLAVYVVMLQGGAWTDTAAGFTALVIAQKVVVIVMLSVVVWLSHFATGATPALTSIPQSAPRT